MLWLRVLSLLLPAHLRYDWLREWHAELYAVRQQSHADALKLLRGAWPDVLALRQALNAPRRFTCGDLLSPRALSLLTATLIAIALFLPNARTMLLAPAYASSGVALLHGPHEKISGEQFTDWSHRLQRLHLQRIAFYHVSIRRVNGTPMRVAIATPDLLQVLRFGQLTLAEGDLVLSHDAAKRLGTTSVFKIGNARHTKTLILPQTTLRLPQDPEAFLITSDVRPSTRGYVLGEKIQSDAFLRQGVALRDGSKETLISYEPIAMRTMMPWRAFCFAVMLALLALPASQPLSSRDAVLDHGTLPAFLRLRAMGFLLLQMSLVLLVSGLAAVILAALAHCEQPANEGLLLALVTFVLALPMLRIVLHGHRHRCPHCLHTLSHPAQVGSPSASFLNWYGTEFVCSRGHGLVHVPDMPTTWFPAPRWVAMDASWAGLFE